MESAVLWLVLSPRRGTYGTSWASRTRKRCSSMMPPCRIPAYLVTPSTQSSVGKEALGSIQQVFPPPCSSVGLSATQFQHGPAPLRREAQRESVASRAPPRKDLGRLCPKQLVCPLGEGHGKFQQGAGALKYILQQLRGYRVLVQGGNTVVVTYISRQGQLHSRRLNRLTVQTSWETQGMETPP